MTAPVTKDTRVPSRPAGTLASRFAGIRDATRALAAPLSPEDCALQSMPDASPVKWHLAHTSWFFETFLLVPSLAGYRPFDPAFKVLYNSYYNAVGDKHPRPERGLISRPDLARVLDYRRHVDEAMTTLLAGDRGELASLVELGLNQEDRTAPAVDMESIAVREDKQVKIAVTANDRSGIQSVELYCDGQLAGRKDHPPYLWTHRPGVGYHTYYAVAADASENNNTRESFKQTVRVE